MKQQLKRVIEFGLKDNVKARIVDGSGKNELQPIIEDQSFCSQHELYNFYKDIYKQTDHISE